MRLPELDRRDGRVGFRARVSPRQIQYITYIDSGENRLRAESGEVPGAGRECSCGPCRRVLLRTFPAARGRGAHELASHVCVRLASLLGGSAVRQSAVWMKYPWWRRIEDVQILNPNSDGYTTLEVHGLDPGKRRKRRRGALGRCELLSISQPMVRSIHKRSLDSFGNAVGEEG